VRWLLDDAGQDIQTQTRSTTASRVTGRDYFPYRILAIQTKLKGQSKQACKLCVDIAKHQAGKATKKFARVCCWKHGVGLCKVECCENWHSKINYWE
jgi:hypothetical protein